MVSEILTKLDQRFEEKEIMFMMHLTERALTFLKEEPDLYTLDELRVK